MRAIRLKNRLYAVPPEALMKHGAVDSGVEMENLDRKFAAAAWQAQAPYPFPELADPLAQLAPALFPH